MSRNQLSVQVSGAVTGYSLRQSRSGSWAHAYTVGKESFTHFSDDVVAVMRIGDTVRFAARKRALKSGSRKSYLAIDPATIEVLATPDTDAAEGGYVYVLVHPAMKGLRKIGFTRSSPEARAASLSGVTGVPGRFSVEWSMFVRGDPMRVERTVHGLLHSQHFEKEFFRVSAERAREAIQSAYADLYPTAAAEVDAAFKARVKAQQAEREVAMQHIEAQRREAARRQSDGYVWTQRGELRVPVLKELQTIERPGLLQRMFGPPVAANAEIAVSAASDRGGTVRWELSINGYFRGADQYRTEYLGTLEEIIESLKNILGNERLTRINCQLTIAAAALEHASDPEPWQVERRYSGLVVDTPDASGFSLTAGSERNVGAISAKLRALFGRTETDKPAAKLKPAAVAAVVVAPQPIVATPAPASRPAFGRGTALPRYPWGSKASARELLKSSMSETEIESYLAQFAD